MGVLYDDIITSKISTRINNFLQLLRRAIFFLVAFNPITQISFGVQILICLYMTLFFNIYVGYLKPFKNGLKNKTELFNEATIFYSTFMLLMFTDFVPKAET